MRSLLIIFTFFPTNRNKPNHVQIRQCATVKYAVQIVCATVKYNVKTMCATMKYNVQTVCATVKSDVQIVSHYEVGCSNRMSL